MIDNRRRLGFTLIELMIAVVIIGLLAAIAVPRLAQAKGHTYVTAMISDLRNLSTHEESYFYDHAVYTSALTDLQSQGFQASPMVSIQIVEATATGWSATADHLLSNVQCGLFVGAAAPVGPATVEGAITCQ